MVSVLSCGELDLDSTGDGVAELVNSEVVGVGEEAIGLVS